MTTASGADSLFGLLVDSPSDLYSIGHPALDVGGVVANPAGLPTAAAGAAGTLTGNFHWRYSHGKADGTLTYPSPASDAALTQAVGTPSLDDATFSGTFNIGGAPPIFEVEIDGEGTPDTFRWRITDGVNVGLWTSTVAITGAAQLLGYGISVTFGATTGHTSGDAWRRESALALTADKGSLSDVEISASSNVTRRVIERTDDYGITWAIVGTIPDNTTTVFTDDWATPDESKVLPSSSQTGGNYGFLFLDVNSFDTDPDFSTLQTEALRGSAGRARGIPGPIAVAGSPKADLKASYLLPILAAGAGAPVVTPLDNGLVSRAVFTATTARRSPKSLSAFTYDGASGIPPTLLYQLACEELSIEFAGGKITDTTFKLVGCNYGTSGPAAQDSGTGTWAGAIVAFGSRYDALAATENVYIKITQALSGGTVKFKVKVGAAATYDGAEYTLYTHAVSGKQTRGGAQFNDAIEIHDEAGLALGADVGSNRQPYTVYFSGGDLADLDVDDVFILPRTALIPGSLSGASPEPYSGAPAVYADGPRFTDAHVTLRKGGAVIDATSGSIKFGFPKKQVNSLCAGARNLQDLVNDGYFSVEVTMVRYLNSSEWRDLMKVDDRVALSLEITGERIPLSQGALSTSRESLVVSVPQFVIRSAKAPKANQSTVVETIVGEAEQPDNPANDLFVATVLTRQTWTIPA